MRARKHLIIDVSSVLKRCFFAGKDKEFGWEITFNEKKVWVNGWEHGREAFLNYMNKALHDLDARPMDCLFVLEGEHGATIRRNIYPGYKQREPRPQEQLDQYSKLEDWLQPFFSRMGACFVKQDGLEADDVVAYLARNLRGKRVVLMDDGDGLTLIDPPNVEVRYQSKIASDAENPLGPFPSEFNRLYKAIVGDKSDTLPGAKGVGDVGFLNLFVACEEDGMRALAKIIEEGNWDEIKGDAQHMKELAKILESSDTVRRCYKAAGFFDHLVNVPGKQLVWMPGMTLEKPEGEVPDERWDRFYQKRTLVHADNFAQLMASGIWAQIRQSPWVSIDIESSTPDESDEWLRAVNDQDEEDAPKGIDILAQRIAGVGFTFGDNQQHTLYLTVDHKTDKNLTPEQLYLFLDKLIKADKEIRYCVHNSSFELVVFFNNLIDHIGENPDWDCGFLPRIDDTLFMASYVDENVKIGLKTQAKLRLNYEQTSYEEVVTCPETGRIRKMNELTPKEVFAYGTDDTIVTSALRTHYQVILELENTLDLYREVEIDAAYLVAAGMVTGFDFNRETMRKQEQADNQKYDAAWAKLRAYLIEQKWGGVEMPDVTLEPASMKQIFQIVTGRELKTQVRTPAKIAALMADEEGAETLGELYQQALSGNMATATASEEGGVDIMRDVRAYARKFFKGEPDLNVDSPKQMTKLMYETMGLPIRVRNRPTAADKAQFGRKAEGSPKSDALAIASAKFYDSQTHAEAIKVLDALHDMRSVSTARKMFYKPYRALKHWRTGKIHGSEGQCMTVTRRFAPNKPNKAQWPKGEKGDFRENIEAHHKDAVVVACDFKAQELRVIADSSGDEAMTSCFVGENKRDMHHLTGVSIAQKKIDPEISYDWFATVIDDESHPMHKQIKGTRKKAKTTNFASEYGAMAPKMAQTLMVPEEEAQSYLDAKHTTFWRAEEWKSEEVIPAAKKRGYALTRLGGRRHLAEAFSSDDWGTRARAERQAVNFEIQGSCAEMTKLAMGRVWRAKLLIRFDAQFIGVVHDELVFSVSREDCVAFTQELHALMTQRYADMIIPIESSIGIGHNFGQLIEIGEQPTTEAITGALRTLFPQWYELAAA
jgi:DNA polymerase I-like protein with 3'-5' exonuclease and polymerase domains/5'-3' exonuclease